MEETLVELHRKLDLLAEQVGFLTEQARAAERARSDRAELVHDLMPVANSLMARASAELEDVQEYVNPEDLVRVLKKLARQLPRIEAMLDQLDGAADLLDVAVPLSRDVFNRAEALLDAADKKGYFTFAKGGMRIVDNIVTSFSEDDVRQLGDNIVLILQTVKGMTQPEVMNFVNSTVASVEREAEGPVDISYRSLFGQMRDPNVRRGLALTMKVLSTVGAQDLAGARPKL